MNSTFPCRRGLCLLCGRLLTGSDLFHFYTHMEGVGQYPYQLPEVHPVVGDIVKMALFPSPWYSTSPIFMLRLSSSAILRERSMVSCSRALDSANFRVYGSFAVNPADFLLIEAIIDFFICLSTRWPVGSLRRCRDPAKIPPPPNRLFAGDFVAVQVISLAGIFELHLNVIRRA